MALSASCGKWTARCTHYPRGDECIIKDAVANESTTTLLCIPKPHSAAHHGAHRQLRIHSRDTVRCVSALLDQASLNGVKHAAERHGAISALGQVVGRNLRAAQNTDAASSRRGLTQDLLQRCVGLLLERLVQPSADARLASCESLAVLARLCELPVCAHAAPAAPGAEPSTAGTTAPPAVPAGGSGDADAPPVSRAGLVKVLRVIAHSPIARSRDASEDGGESNKDRGAAARAAATRGSAGGGRDADRHDVVEAAALALGALAWNDSDATIKASAVKVGLCALGVRWWWRVVLTGWLCRVAWRGVACVAVPVVQALLSMSQVEAEEVHFAVGQALVEAGSGLLPRFKDAPLGFGRAKEGEEEGGADSDARQAAIAASVDTANLTTILQAALVTKLASHRTAERTAAGMWLMTIVHRLGAHPLVQRNLGDFQAAFTLLLGERRQFAQECAGKGLALVFDASPKGQQDELVNSLVHTLSTGQRREVSTASGRVAGGGTGAGTNVSAAGDSTYKEMCSFANEVGQPELIYRFLSLASHHALWNTRGGAGFGLEALMQSGGRDKVAPHLEALIPRLYRYQYDPATRVRDSIGRLWQVLVRDPKAAVEKHLGAILKELLDTMASDKWRERQAAYMGMTDLLMGRQLEEVEAQLERMW